MSTIDDKVYRLLADHEVDDLNKLLASSVGFQVELQTYPDTPVNLQPDSEEEAEGSMDYEWIMTSAGVKWHRLDPNQRTMLLKLAEGAGANASECRETLDLWEAE